MGVAKAFFIKNKKVWENGGKNLLTKELKTVWTVSIAKPYAQVMVI